MVKKIVLVLLFLVSGILYAKSCPLNQNLIKGGSFENPNDLSQWQIAEGKAKPYIANYDFGWAGDAPKGAGDNFLYASDGNKIVLKQAIDLSGCNLNSNYSYNFSAYLGGYGDGDTIKVKVLFKDSNNNIIKRYDTGEKTSNKEMIKIEYKDKLTQKISKAIVKIIIRRNNGIDADGYADLLKLTIYNNVCNTDTPDNLIKNSCVEESANGWHPYNGAENGGWVNNEGHSGTHSLKIKNSYPLNSGWYYNLINIDHKRTITFGGWNKSKNVGSSALNGLDFYIEFADGSYIWFYPKELRFNTGTHDWEHREYTYTFDKDVVKIRPYVLLYRSAGESWFDDIYVKVKNTQKRKWIKNSDGWINIYVNKDFNLIFGGPGYNVRGDFVATGNSVLRGDQHTKYFAGSNASYINDDPTISNLGSQDKGSINSSSANLRLPPYVKRKNIVWAGLFWQGYYKKLNVNNTDEADSAIEGWNRVTLKTPNGKIFSIEAPLNENNKFHSAYNYSHLRDGDLLHFYSAYVDVTDIIKNKSGYDANNTTFTVGNIMCRDGVDPTTWMYFSHINEPNGKWYNNLRMGNFGGWSLIVVYDIEDKELSDNSKESFKNIAIYNGFDEFLTWGDRYDVPFETTINLSGFKTPKNGKIFSKALIFGGGGDYGMGHDTLAIQNKKTDIYADLINKYNKDDDKFNGTFSNKDNLIIPNKTYFQGLDLDIFDVSNYIDNNQNQTKIKFGVVYDAARRYSDQFFPQVIAFSTQLYKPNICYDYAIMDGNYTDIKDINRTFTKEANGKPLKIKVSIKSLESDFDLINSKLQIKFTPNNVNYISGSAKYTVPNTHVYENAYEIDSSNGLIAVGDNPTQNGGTISSNQTIYTIESFNVDNDFNGTFNIYLTSTINFDPSTSVKYTLSTKNGLKRCPTNPTYDPIYWRFNIEKPNVDFNTPENERYSLPTQVAGKPYKVSLASYKKGRDGKFSSPNSINANIELELINAGGFENNSSSGYDVLCEEPSSITPGVFVKLRNQSRKILNIPQDFPTYPTNLALRNATFRMWILTKKVNGKLKIVNNNCQSRYDNQCFDRLYNSTYSGYDKNSYCKSSCTNSVSDQCYKCLKKYFSKPVCARDNFAIRPQSFSIAISDNNETKSNSKLFITNNKNQNIANIAAGYLYRLDINATLFETNTNANGYYFNSNDINNKAILKFNDLPTCYAKNNKTLNILINNGKTLSHTSTQDSYSAKNGLIINNTGKYKLHLEDDSWTLVDQKDYEYKPFKDVEDCIFDSSIVQDDGLQGCKITSDSNGYNDLYIKSYPYKFVIDAYAYNNLFPSFNFIYASNLNNTANSLKDNVMALKVGGTITAKGKNNVILTNFTDTCSADDLILNYDFNTSVQPVKDIYGNNLSLDYFLYDSDDINLEVKHNLSKNTNITFAKKYFKNNLYGISNLNSYININRKFNTPINPFKIEFHKIKAKLNKQITVDLNNAYTPKGAKDVNKSMYLYYGKVASPIKYYDGIYEDSINTPIYFETYCSKSLDECKKMGVYIDTSKSNEINWWVNKNFSVNNFDDYLESSDQNLAIINRISNNITNGIDNNIKIDAVSQLKPYTILVKPTNNFINKYPWLLYNEFQNTPPSYLFKIRFVGKKDTWSGSGNSGHTIDVYKATGKKTHKIDW